MDEFEVSWKVRYFNLDGNWKFNEIEVTRNAKMESIFN
jgi:hypothetical protein